MAFRELTQLDEPMTHQITSSIISEKKCKVSILSAFDNAIQSSSVRFGEFGFDVTYDKNHQRFMTASITSYNNLFIGATTRQEEEQQENKIYTPLVGMYENLSANTMELR